MIYLLHSTVPLGGQGRAGARHYLGSCLEDRLELRMFEHLTGKSGVKIVHAYLEAGATLILARTWPDGSRALERYLKRMGHFSDLCPICRRESGRPPLRTPGSLPMASLPLYVSHLRRRTRASGGVLQRGRPISSSGAYQAGLDLGTTTSSPAVPTAEPADRSGGTTTAATARPRRPADASAGTKQRSGSNAETSSARPRKGQADALAR